MSEDLKPCPACGECDDMIIYTMDNHLALKQVMCICGCSGKYKKTEAEAVSAWNALPRAQVWTTEPPAKPGFYWWRSGQGKNVYLFNIVRSGSSNELFRDENGSWCPLLQYGQWAGPIPTPQDISHEHGIASPEVRP